MEKKFVRAGQLKPGNYVLIDGFVCQIKSIEHSKPGKHGAAKARIVAVGIFDDQKRNLLMPTTDDAEVPIVERSNAQVNAVMGESINITDTTSFETKDIPKPKDIQLKAGDEIEYVKVEQSFRVLRKK